MRFESFEPRLFNGETTDVSLSLSPLYQWSEVPQTDIWASEESMNVLNEWGPNGMKGIESLNLMVKWTESHGKAQELLEDPMFASVPEEMSEAYQVLVETYEERFNDYVDAKVKKLEPPWFTPESVLYGIFAPTPDLTGLDKANKIMEKVMQLWGPRPRFAESQELIQKARVTFQTRNPDAVPEALTAYRRKLGVAQEITRMSPIGSYAWLDEQFDQKLSALTVKQNGGNNDALQTGDLPSQKGLEQYQAALEKAQEIAEQVATKCTRMLEAREIPGKEGEVALKDLLDKWEAAQKKLAVEHATLKLTGLTVTEVAPLDLSDYRDFLPGSWLEHTITRISLPLMEKQIWPHVSAGAKEEGWKAVGATAAVAMEEMDSRLVGHLALAFARNGEPAVAPPLVKLLHNERFHFSVRQGVLDALIRLKNPECIPPLLDVISDPSVSQLLRHGIVSSLDNFGPTVAEASKKKLLAVRDDPKTRVFLYNGINDALLRWRSDGRLADE